MAKTKLLKILREPLAGVWSVAGATDKHPGILFLNKNDLRLRLFLEVTAGGAHNYSHPTLSLVEPPNQPTIIGRTKKAGIVTLFQCAKSDWNVGLAPPGQLTQMELTLLPLQAWAGPQSIEEKATKFTCLNFEARGLHNIMGTVHLEQVRSRNADRQRKKAWLPGDAAVVDEYETISWHGPDAKISRKGKDFRIRLCTEVSHAGSSYSGDVLSTSDRGRITCNGASAEELMEVLFEFEQFVSLFCIGRFRANDISLQIGDEISKYRLLWQMGRNNKASKLKRLTHQVPLSLSRNSAVAAGAISGWFGASEQRKLARWLVYDTLSKSNTSTARYLALCQAWETLGREVVKSERLPAAEFSAACSEAKAIFKKYFDEPTSERLGALLGSANKPSFAKLVEALLRAVPPEAVVVICNNGPDAFVKDVVKVRNKLTHLENDKKLSIDRASRMSIYLTFKLTALFCILEMAALGLPMSGLQSMISKNDICKTARRAIPPK